MAENSHQSNSTETWKDIPGLEGFYQASSFGRIKSCERIVVCRGGFKKNKERIRKLCYLKGYNVVMTSKEGRMQQYLVHRLVALAFLPNPDKFPDINHKDGNKQNNSLQNLEWCDKVHNMQHAAKSGLLTLTWKGKTHSKHPRSKRITQTDLFGNTLKVWDSGTQAAEALNVRRINIQACARGQQATAYGFKWRYV